MKTIKLNGDTFTSATSILAAKDKIYSDITCHYLILVSAPDGITKLLKSAHAQLAKADESRCLDTVLHHLQCIAEQLGVDINAEINRTYDEVLLNKHNPDFIISRGSYLCAIMFARLMSFRFLDAANFIMLKQGSDICDMTSTRERLARLPRNTYYVMPDLYGSNSNGVKLISSDPNLEELLKEPTPIRRRVNIL
jgi:hypothetical protein